MTLKVLQRAAPLPLAARWASTTGPGRDALDLRARSLLTALGSPAGEDLPHAVDAALRGAGNAEVWLALAVLGGRLPGVSAVEGTRRALHLDGPLAALGAAGVGDLLDVRTSPPAVEVVDGAVLVDLHETSRSPFHTGIQRVAREAALRWVRDHEVLLVGWQESGTALHELAPEQRARALEAAAPLAATPALETVLVPWRSTYVLPELTVDAGRVDALHAMFRSRGNRSVVVGHDCVPLTTAEVVGGIGMCDGFARYLAAIAHADVIAATCEGSAREFRGWRQMLAGTGLTAPAVAVAPLPGTAPPPDEAATRSVRDSRLLGGLPLVLVVGSHEPRKNHLRVLHAAEQLWREGLGFSLAFVGGNSWSSDRFHDQVRMLAAAGRPIEALRGVSDDDLWAAYRAARFTIFPSLNEGFGLPLAESLAAGTPAITSSFGSMAEIASGGGALLVDPRDEVALADAVRLLLTDDAVLATLRAAAGRRVARTWDDYADDVWHLVAGR